MIHEKMPEGVPVYSVAYGGPFMGVHGHFLSSEGPTLFELVAGIPDLPAGFMERGDVRVSGHLVPRHLWPFVRPKPSTSGLSTYVTLHLAPRGSGEGQDGSKNIIGLVAALALTIATAGIAAGALAGLGGVFAGLTAGSLGAQILAGTVGLAGSLALAALTAPPTSTSTPRKISETSPASADGNLAEPGGALPRVIGTRRVFPPYVNDAFYEIVGRDEFVTILCALAGPHDLSDIRLGDSPIESSDGLEYETREGWDTDAALTLATKQCRITGSPFQFSEHLRDPDNYDYLKDQANPEDCLPLWHSVATRHGPHEFRIRQDWPAGIMDGAADQEDVFQAVPIRVRIRPLGGTDWINLPEIFYCSRNREAKRCEIILDFSGNEPAMPTPTLNRGWIYAWRSVPTQAVNPIGIGGWTAHPYFGTTGDAYLRYNNTGTTGVLHTHLTEESARFYLDPEMFQPTVYEVQMRRGVMVPKNYITAPGYTMAGTFVYDLFGYVLDAGIYKVLSFSSQSSVSQCMFLRGTSAWDSPPVAQMGDALIAVKAKNRRLDSLSVLASGLVPDWNGTEWTGAVITRNPAPHYRYVLSGALNLDPLDEDLIDEDALIDWRAHCNTEGYTCDAIIQGSRVQDVLQLIASCGYARPVQSERWGVFIDRDTSADAPIQVFSPRNSSGFRFEKALTRLPDGFRVTYREQKADYAEQQITVYRDGLSSGANLEAIAYDGLVTEAKVRGRASFDLDQAEQRGTFYYLDAPPEAIVCRRGDLVGVSHDVLKRQAGAARVKSKTVVSGDITHLLLDSDVNVVNEDDMLDTADMLAVPDMLEVGMQTGLVIRLQDGTFSTHRIAGASGARALIEIETPFADDDASILSGHGTETVKAVGEADEGSLVYWGPVDEEFQRMLVFGISPASGGAYSVTLVDEAPDLIRSAAGTYDAPGSATYDVVGTFYFIVPNYETELVVDLIGASAGSHGITNASTYVAGTAGGDTTFDVMTAGGSPVPADRSTGGVGGTATGGDTNTSGNAGAAPTGTTASGVGGDAPGGGVGGAAVTANGNGVQGTAPGGGASGSFRTISGTNYPTSGSGSGARCQKTYGPGDLTPGDVLTVTIGAAGAAGDGSLQDGGAGQRGEARFSWS